MQTARGAVALRIIDPIADGRWSELADNHPQASVFHTPQWLTALARTYGYRPIAFSWQGSDEPLAGGLVFCRIESWLTGNRLASLPFSDHCQPLTADQAELCDYLRAIPEAGQQGLPVEIRPLDADGERLQSETGFRISSRYWLHRLELRPDLDALYGNLHQSSVRRKIQRAQKAGLVCRQGNSRPLLKQFYGLHSLTRRRQGVPPQPFCWFENLCQELGDRLMVFVTYRGREPVAALVRLVHNRVATYKYGASDPRYHPLGAVQWTFWTAIRHAKQQGAEEWDMGRSDVDNPGLTLFKDRWGAERSRLTYYRCPPSSRGSDAPAAMKRIVPCLPIPLLRAAGRLLYRHFG